MGVKTKKCIFLFSFWSNLLQSRAYVCSGLERKVFFLLFYDCIDHLFDNLQSGKKEIIVLEKSVDKVLNFGFKNL